MSTEAMVELPQFRKKSVIIKAVRWFKHGDHPNVGRNDGTRDGKRCNCERLWEDHGHIHRGGSVCPSQWIIEDARGAISTAYPADFEKDYEAVDGKQE